MPIKYISAVLLMLGSITYSWADDEDAITNQWLVDYIESGLISAQGLIMSDDSNNWNKKESVNVRFNFSTSEYNYVYELNYEENWDVLTKDGLENLPKVKKKFASSRVNTWSNYKGMGSYTEKYERVVPNWQNFDQLAPLLNSLAKYKFDSPINGMFMDDEAKILKKLYKNEDLRTAAFWKQLSFDKKGNVIGISTSYLKSKQVEISKQRVYVINENGSHLYFSPATLKKNAIVSGVKISSDKNSLIVFNAALNRMLFKFAPQIFPNPEVVFSDYLISLQKGSGKQFERLADNSGQHE